MPKEGNCTRLPAEIIREVTADVSVLLKALSSEHPAVVLLSQMATALQQTQTSQTVVSVIVQAAELL